MFSKEPAFQTKFFYSGRRSRRRTPGGMLQVEPPPMANTPPPQSRSSNAQHGVNRRALAVMDKIKDGIDAQMDIPPEITGGAIAIIAAFMIDCHQLMEEKFVFPVFGASQKTADLIAVLREQHAAASKLTDILEAALRGLFSK